MTPSKRVNLSASRNFQKLPEVRSFSFCNEFRIHNPIEMGQLLQTNCLGMEGQEINLAMKLWCKNINQTKRKGEFFSSMEKCIIQLQNLMLSSDRKVIFNIEIRQQINQTHLLWHLVSLRTIFSTSSQNWLKYQAWNILWVKHMNIVILTGLFAEK